MLGRWDKWLIDQASDVPSIIFFFIISCKILWETCLNLLFYNALNIRPLVEESFVPMNQRTSVLYCRLSDFYILWQHSASIPVTAVSRNKTIMGLSLLLLHSRFLLKGKQFYQECQSNVKTSALLQTQSVGTILNEIS